MVQIAIFCNHIKMAANCGQEGSEGYRDSLKDEPHDIDIPYPPKLMSPRTLYMFYRKCKERVHVGFLIGNFEIKVIKEWKAMTDQQKSKYYQIYQTGRHQKRQLVEEYQTLRQNKKTPSAYTLFFTKRYEVLAKQEPDRSAAEMTQIIVKDWSLMSAFEKLKFEEERQALLSKRNMSRSQRQQGIKLYLAKLQDFKTVLLAQRQHLSKCEGGNREQGIEDRTISKPMELIDKRTRRSPCSLENLRPRAPRSQPRTVSAGNLGGQTNKDIPCKHTPTKYHRKGATNNQINIVDKRKTNAIQSCELSREQPERSKCRGRCKQQMRHRKDEGQGRRRSQRLRQAKYQANQGNSRMAPKQRIHQTRLISRRGQILGRNRSNKNIS